MELLDLQDIKRNYSYFDTKNQLKTIQKIDLNLAYMDYATIFFYSFIGD